ncbi:MAG: hypothetical protein PHR43_01025 [Dehalococcoidales bacterium]|nr:hypothetical protein [Dehalococcoidales bacterium]
MKKVILFILIPVLLGGLLLTLPVLAQPSRVPHENPSRVSATTDTAALLLQYSNIFYNINRKEYNNARNLVGEMSQPELPADLRYLVDQYNELCRQLIHVINSLDAALTEATRLIEEKHSDAAIPLLADAEVLMEDAGMVTTEIDAATQQMARMTGLSADAAPAQYKERYDRLMNSLQQLKRLTEEFRILQQTLLQSQLKQQAELVPTRLTLAVPDASFFSGDNITVTGLLSSNGRALANRRIAIITDNITDNITLATADTDPNGAYTTDIIIPGKWSQYYNDREHFTAPLVLRANFTPVPGNDPNLSASESPPVSIDVSFYPTRLDLSVPDNVYPGVPFFLNGQIISRGGTSERGIQILLDDNEYPIATQNATGSFSIEVNTPPQISADEHYLTIFAEPAGRSGGTSVKQKLLILRQLPVRVDIQVAPLVVLSRPLSISGQVYYGNQPMPDAGVMIQWQNSASIVNTDHDGTFTASLPTSIGISIFYRQDIEITVQPTGGLPLSTRLTHPVFTVNPLTLFFLLVLIIAPLLRARRTRRLSAPQIIPAATSMPAHLSITPAEIAVKPGFAGRICAAYRNSLRAIEASTGTFMSPPTTLQEFLGATTAIPAPASQPFTALTNLTEAALYSACELDEDAAVRAEKLASVVQKELYHGTP